MMQISSMTSSAIKTFVILCSLATIVNAWSRCVWARGRVICKKDKSLHCDVPLELMDRDLLRDDVMNNSTRTAYDGHFLIYGCGADLLSPPDPYIRITTMCNSATKKTIKSNVKRVFEPNVADFGDIFLDGN